MWPPCSALGSVKYVKDNIFLMEIGRENVTMGRRRSSVVLKNMDYAVKAAWIKVQIR